MLNKRNDVTGIVQLADKFASRIHDGQLYGNEFPYIVHLRAVLAVAVRFGITDWRVLCGCLLHDAREDHSGKVTADEIEMYFGPEVSNAVEAISEPQEINGQKATRKEKHKVSYPRIKQNWLATIMKLCDRIANVESGGKKVGMYRKEHREFKEYFRNVQMPSEFEDAVNQMWTHVDSLLMDVKEPV